MNAVSSRPAGPPAGSGEAFRLGGPPCRPTGPNTANASTERSMLQHAPLLGVIIFFRAALPLLQSLRGTVGG